MENDERRDTGHPTSPTAEQWEAGVALWMAAGGHAIRSHAVFALDAAYGYVGRYTPTPAGQAFKDEILKAREEYDASPYKGSEYESLCAAIHRGSEAAERAGEDPEKHKGR